MSKEMNLEKSTLSQEDSPAKILAQQVKRQESLQNVAGCGESSLGLSSQPNLIGASLRMFISPGGDGCPSCGAVCGASDTPACHLECPPQKLVLLIGEHDALLLPTPTATSYGYSQGGAGGRVGKKRYSLQRLGIGHPEDWERMMGFPIGWTDLEH